jgi:hypothetical protein
LRLLDIAATGALAAREAGTRPDWWSATARVGTRRPGRVESALLRAGRHSYVTYHSLRRVIGDALVNMRTGAWLYPAAASPQALLDHVQQATARLADAAPDDMLVAVPTACRPARHGLGDGNGRVSAHPPHVVVEAERASPARRRRAEVRVRRSPPRASCGPRRIHIYALAWIEGLLVPLNGMTIEFGGAPHRRGANELADRERR